jgi:hypothetical protein
MIVRVPQPKFSIEKQSAAAEKPGGVRRTGRTRGRTAPPNKRRSSMGVSLNSVAENWAAAVALWALPYLTLLGYLRPETAQSEMLQWSLLLAGVLGFACVISAAWKDTTDPTWRASHGLPPRARPRAPPQHSMPSEIKNAASM